MAWYSTTLIKYKKEIISSAILSIILSVALLLWHFILGRNFVWTNIEPISAPSIYDRMFYSALTFISVGAFLYWIKFYRFLYYLTVKLAKDWKLYKDVKKFIWSCLIIVMFAWIVPKIVEVLNWFISFLYNIFGLILYSLPPIGLSLIITLPIYIAIKRRMTIK